MVVSNGSGQVVIDDKDTINNIKNVKVEKVIDTDSITNEIKRLCELQEKYNVSIDKKLDKLHKLLEAVARKNRVKKGDEV